MIRQITKCSFKMPDLPDKKMAAQVNEPPFVPMDDDPVSAGPH
jgi:hypothetical protein